MAKKDTSKKPSVKPSKKTELKGHKRSGSKNKPQKGTGPRTKK